MREVLFISNSEVLSQEVKEEVSKLVNLFSSNDFNVNMFAEDTNLVQQFIESNIKWITTLYSGADRIIYKTYTPNCLTDISPNNSYDEIYKKSVKRYKAVTRDKAYDELMYNTLRKSTMENRMKFCMSKIAEVHPFIVLIKGQRQSNYVNSIVPTFGDGKFIYIYDTVKGTKEFFVGGVSLREEDFLKCVEG